MNLRKELYQHHTNFLKNREQYYFEVIAGPYRKSVFKVNNISVIHSSITSYDYSRRKGLRFEYSQINFLIGNDIEEVLYYNEPLVNTSKVDIVGQELNLNDVVAFTSSSYKKRSALRLGTILSIENKKSVKIKTIPLDTNEKSLIIDIVWDKNIIKLSKEQEKSFMVSVLSI